MGLNVVMGVPLLLTLLRVDVIDGRKLNMTRVDTGKKKNRKKETGVLLKFNGIGVRVVVR